MKNCNLLLATEDDKEFPEVFYENFIDVLSSEGTILCKKRDNFVPRTAPPLLHPHWTGCCVI